MKVEDLKPGDFLDGHLIYAPLCHVNNEVEIPLAFPHSQSEASWGFVQKFKGKYYNPAPKYVFPKNSDLDLELHEVVRDGVRLTGLISHIPRHQQLQNFVPFLCGPFGVREYNGQFWVTDDNQVPSGKGLRLCVTNDNGHPKEYAQAIADLLNMGMELRKSLVTQKFNEDEILYEE